MRSTHGVFERLVHPPGSSWSHGSYELMADLGALDTVEAASSGCAALQAGWKPAATKSASQAKAVVIPRARITENDTQSTRERLFDPRPKCRTRARVPVVVGAEEGEGGGRVQENLRAHEKASSRYRSWSAATSPARSTSGKAPASSSALR